MRRPFAQRGWSLLASAVGVAIVGYFVYHTIEGDHGWRAMTKLQAQVSTAESTLSALQSEHKDLDRRVQMMRPEHLDPDLLDEESRKQLDYSKPNEVVIMMPKEEKREK